MDKYEVLFEDAWLCRRVQTKCGKEAKHFEPNKLGFLKVIKKCILQING